MGFHCPAFHLVLCAVLMAQSWRYLVRVGSTRPREQPRAARASRSTQTTWVALACAVCPAVTRSFRRLVCAKQSQCGVLARPLPGTFFRVLSPFSACPQCSLVAQRHQLRLLRLHSFPAFPPQTLQLMAEVMSRE